MNVVHTAPTELVSEKLSVRKMSDELGSVKMRANVWTLAEGSMLKHLHREQEELYLVLEGSAQVVVNGTIHKLDERDALCVPAGAEHQVFNSGWGPLTFFVAAAPAVADDAERV
jgi:mannose-6-phosphate isomerase-like protein (cupin superfamily)